MNSSGTTWSAAISATKTSELGEGIRTVVPRRAERADTAPSRRAAPRGGCTAARAAATLLEFAAPGLPATPEPATARVLPLTRAGGDGDAAGARLKADRCISKNATTVLLENQQPNTLNERGATSLPRRSTGPPPQDHGHERGHARQRRTETCEAMTAVAITRH